MSLHKSLKTKDELARRRNVLTRAERFALMNERGIWTEGAEVFGLPKLRTSFKLKKRKKKEEPEEAAAEGAEGGESAEKASS